MYTYSALDYTSLLDPGPLSIQSPDGPVETGIYIVRPFPKVFWLLVMNVRKVLVSTPPVTRPRSLARVRNNDATK